uniref:t-SNARE coiled-coil homology domain-containing protein n=1 Tax=Scleropages formosus TaxID=113540 RepID=A0A8C9VGA9_SCLFO
MKDRLDELRGYGDEEDGVPDAVDQIRAMQEQHYAWEMEYMGRLKEQIARQTQLAGLELGEEEIQQLAEGPLAPRLVGADIQALEALRQLALAQERHQQLLALEQQISELHDLFLSLGVMVSRQQSQVDSIEMNVLRTLDYVSDSTQEVKKALQYQRRSRLAALTTKKKKKKKKSNNSGPHNMCPAIHNFLGIMKPKM